MIESNSVLVIPKRGEPVLDASNFASDKGSARGYPALIEPPLTAFVHTMPLSKFPKL